jgi:hypothetical protein
MAELASVPTRRNEAKSTTPFCLREPTPNVIETLLIHAER